MPVNPVPGSTPLQQPTLRRTQSDADSGRNITKPPLKRGVSEPAAPSSRPPGTAGSAASRPMLARSDVAKLAVLSRLKREPYASIKGDSGIQLNGEVDLPGETPDAAGDTTIWCRHFATRFVQQQGKKRMLVDQFDAAASIRAMFSGQLAALCDDHDVAIARAPQHAKHLVHATQFGRYLSAMATALGSVAAAGEPADANSLLIAANHVMAAHVQRKTKNGQAYYTAKVFDPNHTANYKRVEAQHPQDLERLQFKDLLIDPNAGDDYAPPGETLTLAAVCVEHNNLHMSQLQCTPLNPGQQLPRASDLFLALGNGLHEALTAMAQALADHAGMTAQELLGVLSAKDPGGTPGLHMAMQEGHADTLRVFSGILQSAELPIDDKARLLAARDAAGTPGLSVAMEDDHADTVRAFGEALQLLNLPHSQAVPLLAAKNNQGDPGLWFAMQQGCTDTVHAFGAALKSLGLPSNQVAQLLTAIDGKGIPALLMAMRFGHADTVKAYGNAIQSLELSSQDTFDLVAAAAPNGIPGIVVALGAGQLDSAKAGCDIFTALDIDPQKALDLLQPYGNHPELSAAAVACLNAAMAEQEQRLTDAASS
jgi:hypothetical protein